MSAIPEGIASLPADVDGLGLFERTWRELVGAWRDGRFGDEELQAFRSACEDILARVRAER